ncbi:Crp/Fnr family transcriptional regulator [Pedobacter hartonius]|uniref:cAMP-binding domain of CRP or a regulatory subunit of cAMP-dependent protein kinases n=1 Tax=Pedobacter hartonius TaxID=425514 RepID=A0A1H3WCI9_9SPHI|nr:Crp/Fnr family transcriptional regulator [Pedobacter hartonius]SDZ84541.1 cAMP-binding domain of CRP or a regulatory subunit of cAMP-dependent protein kinases [Pedobacter hartonius]
MKILDSLTNEARLERIITREILPKIESMGKYLSNAFIESLIFNSKLMEVFKGEIIEHAGPCTDGNLLYINTGIAHTFYYDSISQKPLITKIWKKHDIIFDLGTFLNSENRKETIQMLEDGELLGISYDNLKKLLDTFPNMVSFLLHLQVERERQYKYYQHLLRLTVDEKVKLYLSDNPAIINRINNEYIAMHLGVSRSRFSKAYVAYKRGNHVF